MSDSAAASPDSLGETGALYRGLSWVVTVLTPVALVLTAVRLLVTPAFVQLEYRTPGFPDDPYGFSREERLYWSDIAREYLLNDAGIEFLGDLRFEDGSPVYNERELGHMIDVKYVLGQALALWVASLSALVILGFWALRGGWRRGYRRGLARGGWWTVVFVAVIIPLVLVGFGVFFVAFHEVFFNPGTWVFNFSDTLIRLFPERFWRDAFLAIAL
ncbi:MAG TPA: TIGR01906 family membrane protein, partial [Anaerolineales bacterium]|nr:TIGR01906 family membrane protein [Anaerolineales bacterium]